MRRLVAAIALSVACAPCAALTDRDTYDPGALASRVRELADAGDFAAARILLARARRISPEDARVARAREALEARESGKEPPAQPAPAGVEAGPAAPSRAAPVVAPAPPAIWKSP